ncbi:MAG: outer membrane beta-barrel protein [Pseudomonadota bacterium]
MKKILFATAALLAFSATSAEAQQQQRYEEGSLSPLSGFYLGGTAGYGNGEGGGLGSDDYEGGEYGVFAGYKADAILNRTVNQMGIGLNGAIEAHYIWSDADSDAIEKDTEWGVSFRPGFSVLDEVTPLGLNPYGIIGYRRAEFETAAETNDHDGFELGIGTEVLAYNNIGVRIDYAHTWYEEKNDYDPTEHTIRAGLAYHF